MTVWFCDRCGAQVTREANGAGKYDIQKSCMSYSTEPFGDTRFYKRGLKFCDTCAVELEKFLDDEFSRLPSSAVAQLNKGE